MEWDTFENLDSNAVSKKKKQFIDFNKLKKGLTLLSNSLYAKYFKRLEMTYEKWNFLAVIKYPILSRASNFDRNLLNSLKSIVPHVSMF